MPSIPVKSRLRRRGGPDSQSNFNLGMDTSFEEDRKSMETSADIRKLYEQTRVETVRPIIKRSRVAPREPSVETMDLDEEDPVQATLRKAARLKKEGKTQSSLERMPPPAQIPRSKSPTSEPEEVEETARPRMPQPPPRSPSPVKAPIHSKGFTQSEGGTEAESRHVTKDEAFLQAITKASNSKKAVDELDKEFNQLRIPKSGAPGGSTTVKANVWDANHPDYTIVNDFGNDLRGNFIQIIKKDLIRKDLGKARVERADDGRPNYKKFKKVSRLVQERYRAESASRRT